MKLPCNTYFCCLAADVHRNYIQDDDLVNDRDFLSNVTRTKKLKAVKFGHGSVTHGRDSRYWDGDDRRRDEDYHEDDLEQAREHSVDKDQVPGKEKNSNRKTSSDESHNGLGHRGNGLYNEAGRNELKMYEAEYEASLKIVGQSKGHGSKNQLPHDRTSSGNENEMVDPDDEYDDGIDLQDGRKEDYDEMGQDDGEHSGATTSDDLDGGESANLHKARTKHPNIVQEIDESSTDLSDKELLSTSEHSGKVTGNSRHARSTDSQFSRRSASEKRSGSKKKPKRRKFSGQYMLFLLYGCFKYYIFSVILYIYIYNLEIVLLFHIILMPCLATCILNWICCLCCCFMDGSSILHLHVW